MIFNAIRQVVAYSKVSDREKATLTMVGDTVQCSYAMGDGASSLPKACTGNAEQYVCFIPSMNAEFSCSDYLLL